MSELPKGWDYQDVGSFNNHKGKNIKPSDFPDEVFEVFSVPTFASGKPEYLKGSDIGSSKQVVQSGDVLVCKINPRINRVWVVPTKGNYRQIASSEWINVRNEEFDSRYLKYAFKSQSFRDLICSEVTGVGGSLTRAQPKKVAGYKIPVAPIHEQKRIADKLDSVLAKVEAAQARLDKIPAILKRFRQSVLAAATSGELTKDWREENVLVSTELKDLENYWKIEFAKQNRKFKPYVYDKAEFTIKGWLPSRLGAVCDVHIGATPKRTNPSFWGGDVRWVSSSEVAFCEIYDTKEKITDEGLTNSSTKLHPPGTVMLAMIGQGKTRGQPAILKVEACHNQNTAALRVPEPYLVSEYLYYLLWERYEETRKIGGGNNQQALNKATVQSIDINLPSVEEQKVIVEKVEQLFEKANTVERQYRFASNRINKLTQSVLAKAFRGELLNTGVKRECLHELSELETL